MMYDIWTWIIFAVVGAVSALVLRQVNPAFSLCIGIFCACGILLGMMSSVSGLSDFLRTLSVQAGIDDDGFEVLLKALGVGYLTQFASDLCKDAGESALASSVETVGRVTIVCLAMEPASALLTMIGEMLKG